MIKIFVVYILVTVLYVSICSGAGLRHTNVALVVDVDVNNHKYSEELLKKVLDGVSLLKYRVSLFTTYGVKETLIKFQSRQCMLGKLRKKHRFQRLTDVIYEVQRDLNQVFSKDNNIVLLVTDKLNSKWLTTLLNSIAGSTKNIGVYVNFIFEQTRYKHYGRHSNLERSFVYRKKQLLLNKKVILISKGSIKTTVQQLPFLASLQKCNGESFSRDECNRRCECVNGKRTNCYRIRKEFSSMSKKERLRFVAIYKEFSTSQNYEPVYSNYVKYHFQFFSKGLHTYSQFFPWHRRYILGFENYLRLLDCRVALPYWNWALHEKHAFKVTHNHHIWRSVGGLGGNGDGEKNFCITSGVLAKQWRPPKYEKPLDVLNSMCGNFQVFGENEYLAQLCSQFGINKNLVKSVRCLRRRFNGRPPSYKQLYYVIKTKNVHQFRNFEDIVRVGWHNNVHNCVGGEMETEFSSNTPEFWMHHNMLDCAWEKWQQKGHAFKHNFFQNKKTKLLGFKPTEYRYLFVKNDDLAGCGIKVTCQNILPKKVFYRRKRN